jgi:hypothetical protein
LPFFTNVHGVSIGTSAGVADRRTVLAVLDPDSILAAVVLVVAADAVALVVAAVVVVGAVVVVVVGAAVVVVGAAVVFVVLAAVAPNGLVASTFTPGDFDA